MALSALALALLATTAAAQDCLDAGQWFVEAPDAARGYGNSQGVNLNDFDGDGDVDILVAQSTARVNHAVYYPGENLLYLQEGDLEFVEAGAEWGVDDQCEDRHPLFGDLDNDGAPDLYVTVNGRNLLLRNDGGAGYTDVTARAGAAGHPGWGHQGILLDYDRDGALDVFFTNGPEDGSGNNTLLRNQGDGTFRDVSYEAGVAGTPSGKGACPLDVDGDGWLDLFVGTGRGEAHQLYINRGDGTFSEEAAARGVASPLGRFAVGAWCGDIDGDGDEDILTVTHDADFTGNQLFLNLGGAFDESAGDLGLRDETDGHGLAVADLDLDGQPEVIFAGLRDAPSIFQRGDDGVFQRLCQGAGLDAEAILSWAVVAGDLTADGYPELYLSGGLPEQPRENRLFRNLGGQNGWIEVTVQGVTHNPSGIGALVEVTAGGETRRQRVGSWASFNSQGPLPLVFGIGGADRVERVKVTFTNGVVETLSDLSPGERVVVVEPAERTDDDFDGVPDEWDACPGTGLGQRTDGQGCAIGQRGGPGLALLSPAEDAIWSEPAADDAGDEELAFTWAVSDAGGQADPASFVVQVSGDGAFGPAGRIDLGPVAGDSYAPTADERAAIAALSDGSAPLLWRVAAAGGDGQAITAPRRLYWAIPAELVRVPLGANVFEPAHVTAEVGQTLTWWNDAVAAGNLQNEPHDVQLVDPGGAVVSQMVDLNGGGFFTWTFDTPGTWRFICHRHSGEGVAGDQVQHGTRWHHAEGPYRCMAGSVTAR